MVGAHDIDGVLNNAVTLHLAKLFDALMSAPPHDTGAIDRFEEGVRRLLKTADDAEGAIARALGGDHE